MSDESFVNRAANVWRVVVVADTLADFAECARRDTWGEEVRYYAYVCHQKSSVTRGKGASDIWLVQERVYNNNWFAIPADWISYEASVVPSIDVVLDRRILSMQSGLRLIINIFYSLE